MVDGEVTELTQEFDVRLELFSIIKHLDGVEYDNIDEQYIKDLIDNKVLTSDKHITKLISIIRGYDMNLPKSLVLDDSAYKEYMCSEPIVSDVTYMLKDDTHKMRR